MSYEPPKDLYTIKGDMDRGVTMSTNVTRAAAAHPNILYGDRLLITDLYLTDGEAMLNVYCPRCLNSLQISSKRKAIEWDPDFGLFVEPFTCPWELGDRGDERTWAG